MASDQTLQPGESIKLTSTTPIDVVGSGSTTVTAKAAAAAPEPGPEPTPPPATGEGVLISKAELMALPMSGSGWNNVTSWASKSISTTGMLSNQESAANVTTLAAALVAVRKGDAAARGKVVTALKALKNQSLDRALALGRELGAYVIASDLIGATDAEVGYNQRDFYRGLLTKATTGGPSNLLACAKDRPNNWGTHAHGAVACVYAKYGTDAEKDNLHKWVKGWLGDLGAYNSYKYSSPYGWHADLAAKRGINAKGTSKQGMSIDGVLPDDQRRGGDFTTNPPNENYVYEALQGALLAAIVLERTGRSVARQQDEALYRAYRWLIDVNKFTPSGDDTWEPWALRKLYPAHKAQISASSPTTPGKNFGFTDWLYNG